MNPSNRQNLLAFAAIACVGLLVGQSLVFSPLYGIWKDRSSRLSAMKKEFTEGQRLIQREPIDRASWRKMSENTLPEGISEAESKLLESYKNWLQTSGVVGTIRLSWKDGETDRNRNVLYRTLECRVDAGGTLPALTRFLYEIEKDPLGLKVESVELTSRDDNGQQLQLGLQISGLQLVKTPAKS